MKKIVLFSAMGVLAATGTAALAQEVGRVLSSTPVIQQVAVQRQVCNNQPIAVQQTNSGAGAALGTIAGGVLGNQIGHGSGRAVATIIGAVGGAMVGNNIEGSGSQVQNYQQCSPQTYYENRTVGYNVVYEYAGKEYRAQMPQDPGPTLQLQVSPMSSSAQPQTFAEGGGTPVGVIVGQPQVATYTSTYPAYPAYPVYAPRPYYAPYFAPIGLSLSLGYVGGHRHRGHHWR